MALSVTIATAVVFVVFLANLDDVALSEDIPVGKKEQCFSRAVLFWLYPEVHDVLDVKHDARDAMPP